jgi:pimeloyl-ACP methyl ester carboxylesterase
MKALPVVLCCLAVLPCAGWAQENAAKGMEGTWLGTLDVGGTSLRIVFNIKRKPDGALSGTLDSPDQGAMGIPLDMVTLTDGALRIEQKALGGVYEGKLSSDGAQVEGKWTQSGVSLPLTLKRTTAAVPKPRRPQEPKKPYPYRAIEVTYPNKKAGIRFAGTLTLPRGKGPFPAALLITGSGAQNRDEEVFGHKPFLVLADYLTRRRIAVLRVDDRGVGGSTGSLKAVTGADLADDALAGVNFLKSRPEINPRRIGLIGHSEGGILAPMAATKSRDVAYIVMMAGTGLPGEDILYMQGALVNKAMGATDEALAINRKMQEGMFAIVKQEPDNAKAAQRLQELWKKTKDALPEDQKKAIGGQEAAIQAQMQAILTPWFRYFLTYDPRPALRRVRCPVLAVNGAKDMQVPPKENLREIAAALKAGGNKDCTVKELPGLNHLFQTAFTGSPAEYARIEETISPVALKVIGDWIVRHAGRKPGG